MSSQPDKPSQAEGEDPDRPPTGEAPEEHGKPSQAEGADSAASGGDAGAEGGANDTGPGA